MAENPKSTICLFWAAERHCCKAISAAVSIRLQEFTAGPGRGRYRLKVIRENELRSPSCPYKDCPMASKAAKSPQKRKPAKKRPRKTPKRKKTPTPHVSQEASESTQGTVPTQQHPEG